MAWSTSCHRILVLLILAFTCTQALRTFSNIPYAGHLKLNQPIMTINEVDVNEEVGGGHGSSVDGVAAGSFIDFPFSGRTNKLFVPSSASSSNSLPLFVMLHGCTQNPTDFAKGTKMNEIGEAQGFFVLYPEQPSSANANKCWNWFQTVDQARSGEPKIIADMVLQVVSKYTVDTTRIYVAGLSAGGAMSVIVGVVYPEIFAGIGVGAGLEFKAATSMINAYTAMSSGGPNPVSQGIAAYKAAGSRARVQGVLVVHGTSDYTVALVNGKQVVTQFTTQLDYVLGDGQSKGYITDIPTTTTKGQVSGGHSYTTYEYADTKPGHGQVLVKFIEVASMGHAWSGGSTAGSYTDPKGPDASALLVNWFLSSFPPSNETTTTTGTTGTTGTSGTSTTTGGTTGSTTGTTTGSTTGSTTGAPNTVYLEAVQRESGYVGRFASDGYGTNTAKAGDKGMFNIDTYRAILSFDTGAIPAGAKVVSAYLRVVRKSLTGTITDLVLDIKQGHFGSSVELAQSDYSATASAGDVTLVPVPSKDGGYSEVHLPENVLQFINNEGQVNGRTQFRIKAEATATFAANAIEFYAGDAADPQNDAALVVEFQ